MAVVIAKNGTLPIPQDMWDWMGLGAESMVEITTGPGHTLQLRTGAPKPDFSIRETAGILPKPAGSGTIEAMNEAIAGCSEQ